jgi:hypothetical protein
VLFFCHFCKWLEKGVGVALWYHLITKKKLTTMQLIIAIMIMSGIITSPTQYTQSLYEANKTQIDAQRTGEPTLSAER